MEELFTVEFTKDEISLAIVQIGARIDALIEIQKESALKGDVSRVVSLEQVIRRLEGTQIKMMEVSHR